MPKLFSGRDTPETTEALKTSHWMINIMCLWIE